MDRCVGAAAKLRQSLAIQALARSATISDLATRHGVSRKFIYQQTDKARTALDDAFLSAAPEDEVLFETWQCLAAIAAAPRVSAPAARNAATVTGSAGSVASACPRHQSSNAAQSAA